MNYKVLVFLLAGAGLQSLAAQTLTARQLFYKDDAEAKPAAAAPKAAPKSTPKKASPAKAAKSSPAPSDTPATSEVPTPKPEPVQVQNAAYTPERPLGLRYALVKVTEGAESEVSPTATFHSGDMVRVKVEGNRDGYLYVVARGSSGNWKPLFPAADINGGNNRVVARRGYRLPSNTQAFTFDEQAGEERLFIIYSAEPVKDMEAMIPTLAGRDKPETPPRPLPVITASAAPINDEFVSRMRNTYSRDLIVQTVTPGQAAESPKEPTLPESAVYVVNKTGGRLVADIRLEHR